MEGPCRGAPERPQPLGHPGGTYAAPAGAAAAVRAGIAAGSFLAVSPLQESGLWRLLPLRVWRHLVPSSGTNSTANPGCSWRVGVGVKGQRLCATAALAAGSGLCRGCQHRADVLIPVCPCRIWTTVSFPNGMRSWSWMRNEGKGGSKEGDGGLGAPGRAGGASAPAGTCPGVSPGAGGHGTRPPAAQLEWEPETLPERGCSRIAASAAAPAQPPELPRRVKSPACSLPAVSYCPPCPGVSRFPGGIFSGSGNREFYSGCSSECTKGKEFRSQSLKLPHFSLSQMTVSVFGIGGQAGVLGGQAGVCCLQRGMRAGAV